MRNDCANERKADCVLVPGHDPAPGSGPIGVDDADTKGVFASGGVICLFNERLVLVSTNR
jgi:hypothetical protein